MSWFDSIRSTVKAAVDVTTRDLNEFVTVMKTDTTKAVVDAVEVVKQGTGLTAGGAESDAGTEAASSGAVAADSSPRRAAVSSPEPSPSGAVAAAATRHAATPAPAAQQALARLAAEEEEGLGWGDDDDEHGAAIADVGSGNSGSSISKSIEAAGECGAESSSPGTAGMTEAPALHIGNSVGDAVTADADRRTVEGR